MALSSFGAKPLSIPGTPSVAPAKPGASPFQTAMRDIPKPVRTNRRLGARKTSRMGFTPPQKLTAFKAAPGGGDAYRTP